MENSHWTPPESLHSELAWAAHHQRDGAWVHLAPRVASASLWHVTRGELRVESDDQTQIARAGDWVWRPPCGARRVEVAAGGARWSSVGIVALCDGRNWFAPPLPLLFRPEVARHRRGAQMMHLLVEAHQVGASRLEIGGLGRALMGWGWSASEEAFGEAIGPRQFPIWLQSALRTLAREPGVSVAHLAREAHFSPAQFRRLWEKYLGAAPRETVLRRRLEIARHLLENGALGVNEIAVRSGFAGAAQLNRAFRGAFGQSPLEWKRAAGERV